MKMVRIVVGLVALTVVAGCHTKCEQQPVESPRISVFTHYIHGVAKQRGISLEAAADRLHALGVRGFDAGYYERDLERLAATKLKPINLYGRTSFLVPNEEHKTAEAMLATAEKYGVSQIMAIPDRFSDGGDEEAEFQKILEGMRWFVTEAKKRGITITVEDFGGEAMNPCNRMVYLKRFLDEIPDLKLALDSGNLYYARRGEDILELMKHAPDRIAHVHLKDQLPSDHRTYAELGLGGVPNAEIIHYMTRRNYDGWYTLENVVVGADVYIETVRQIAVLKAWQAEAHEFE